MNFIYFFTITIIVLYAYSTLAKPWIAQEGSFELAISDTIYSTTFSSRISHEKYMIRKELAELYVQLDETNSRRKKAELNYKISVLKILDKHRFDYYETYHKYLGFEDGISNKASIAIYLTHPL
jgi:hypothetical protein